MCSPHVLLMFPDAFGGFLMFEVFFAAFLALFVFIVIYYIIVVRKVAGGHYEPVGFVGFTPIFVRKGTPRASCPSCGAPVLPGWRYCPSCGRELSALWREEGGSARE